MPNLVPQKWIEDKIFLIRKQKVMLDRNLAELYGVKAIRLREQVKRNKKRFPKDFMFQLTAGEADILVSQNAIPSKRSLGGYLPYAFTEQGVAMLSSVLNSERAIQVNIQIMRAFIKIKEMALSNKELQKRIDVIERKSDQRFKVVFDVLRKLLEPPKKSKIIEVIGFQVNKDK